MSQDPIVAAETPIEANLRETRNSNDSGEKPKQDAEPKLVDSGSKQD